MKPAKPAKTPSENREPKKHPQNYFPRKRVPDSAIIIPDVQISLEVDPAWIPTTRTCCYCGLVDPKAFYDFISTDQWACVDCADRKLKEEDNGFRT